MCLPLLDTPGENIVKYFRQANLFIQDALAENDEATEQIVNRVLVHW
jgi:hypothetical protein